MKVYTGGGDKGKTSLFSGERVAKHSLRIDAYGDLDELNSVIGLVLSKLPEQTDPLEDQMLEIQSRLFQAGAWMATTPNSPATEYLEVIPHTVVKDIEEQIDLLSESLPPLKIFILPGGHEAASTSHVARTVCRRCERKVSQLIDEADGEQGIEPLQAVQVYLNRLSDYLFVAARYINHRCKIDERGWQQQ